jgi:prevent-host-death family protein
MPAYGTHDAKNRLSELLDRVERGEEVTITRNGKPVARLVAPAVDEDKKARARAAMERIKEIRQNVKPLDGITIKELIDEGRRF